MPHATTPWTLIIVLLSSWVPLLIQAQDSKEREDLFRLPSVTALRVDEAPVLDGRMDDPAWANAEIAGPFLQVIPREGVEATERTEFRVVYTAEALYIGLWCFDREPDKIIARMMARDSSLGKDDCVSLSIDTFLDRRNGYRFRVNPNGAQNDSLITNNTDLNEDWDGVWSVAARVDEEGWKAEIEIPFSSISFDPATDVWGINSYRYIKRKNELCRWSRPLQNLRSYQLSEAGYLKGLRGMEQKLGVEVSPYAITKFRDERRVNDTDLSTEFGGEVRYRVTPDLSASLSYNTDFAETEVDERQINLTRFPVFYPEKRDFFLEDAGIFNFGRVGSTNKPSGPGKRRGPRASTNVAEPIPFFSRKVGLGSDGHPRSILGAAKVTGRVGDYNIGLLDAFVDEYSGLQESNLFSGRVSRNVFDQSSIGVIATHGNPDSENENFLGGADLGLRTSEFLDNQVLQTNLWTLGSWTENEQNDDALSYGGSVELPNDLYRTNVQFFQVGEDFDPTMGFVYRRNVRAYLGEFSYRPRPQDLHGIRQMYFTYSNSHYTDLDDRLETARHSFSPVYLYFHSGDQFFTEVSYELDSPRNDFEISEGIEIPPGDYWWPSATIGFDTTSRRLVEAEFAYTLGEFYEGDLQAWESDVAYRPSKYFSISTGYELNVIRLPQGNFKTRLAWIKKRISLSPQLNWFNILQYDNISDSLGFQSRVQWEYRTGSNIYLVLNQGIERNEGRLAWTESELTLKVGLRLRF